MKKLITLVLTFSLILCLAACGAGGNGDSAPRTADGAQSAETAPSAPEDAGEPRVEPNPDGSINEAPTDGQWVTITVQGVDMLWNGRYVKEPDSRLDIDTMSFSDFGDGFFEDKYPVEVESYTLCPGEIMETEVVHIKAAQEGKVIYIVAGVHGDEVAAWYAGRLLRDVTIKSGELYIVAPANANGARNGSRYVKDEQDMNRVFPGDPDGDESQRIADAIYQDIARVHPFMVFDLHEAIIYTAGRDFLGSTLIFTSLGDVSDMFFDMLFATQTGELGSNEFGYTGPGPIGSINNTVSNELGIPTITVETFRGFDIYRRVHDQLDIVQYALAYQKMR